MEKEYSSETCLPTYKSTWHYNPDDQHRHQDIYRIVTNSHYQKFLSVLFNKILYILRMGEERKVYKVLVGKPEGKRPLGRPRRRWEDGIRMDLREIGLGGVDWIRLSQDKDRWRAVVSAVMNLRVLAPRS
jgi:hypothetical protein